ncbi:hypothetical protein, partial [Streptomyces sp. NPDC055189]
LRRVVLHDHEMSVLRSSGSSVSCVQHQGSRPGFTAVYTYQGVEVAKYRADFEIAFQVKTDPKNGDIKTWIQIVPIYNDFPGDDRAVRPPSSGRQAISLGLGGRGSWSLVRCGTAWTMAWSIRGKTERSASMRAAGCGRMRPMRTMKRVLLAAAAASLLVAGHGAAAAASAPAQSRPVQSAPAAGPGWHHVADFPAAEETRCHERGRWYTENGARAYECRPAGDWQLWVLTEPS